MLVIWVVVAVIAVILLLVILLGIKIVPQTSIFVVERLGSFNRILRNGIHYVIPIFDKIVLRETIKEKVLDFPAQDVITKDNVTMKIDTVVYMQIMDPKLFAYGVDQPIFAIQNLTSTTLRNVVGDLELDQTLTSRDTVNEKLRQILDEATDAWGMKIIRVELKNILPPEDIRRAMEKQMRAEREKREQILVAEGRKQASILNAEGEKLSFILSAEGRKKAAILNAEAKKQSYILEGEGKKRSFELINEASPNQQTLMVKSFDTLAEAANNEATTIIIPTDLSDISRLASSFSAINKNIHLPKKTTKEIKPFTQQMKESK